MRMHRVTEILQPFSDFSMVPEDKLQAACDRGTEVHQYLYSYALGLWSPRPEGHEGYCESAERWLDQHVKKVISAEEEFTDKTLGFLGHPDLVAETDMGLMLVDYKTPIAEARSWAIQISGAYHHLVTKKLRVKKLIPSALMLSPKGGAAKLRRYEENQTYFFSIFLGALNALRYFEEGKP